MPIATTDKQRCAGKSPAGKGAGPALPLVLALFFVVIAGFAAAAAEDSPSPGAIVVTIPLTAPDSTEQDVATQYGLEPVERRDSQVLEQRIVVYRIPQGRAASEVLRQVGADARVSSAQPNFQYEPLPVRMPDPIIASRQRDDTLPSKAKRRATAAASKIETPRRRAATARVALAEETLPRPMPRETTASLAPRSRTSALGGNLAWPTADEPFVGTPSSR
jgi:hypothetical protein